ncbi:hypothetical protein AB395_00006406 (plasmid) [Sinorhizobium fredii CCBAU 45436]|nr:hypothetical protein AB395_00006406 [Sinorhizobium fredii CCBAU 45436]
MKQRELHRFGSVELGSEQGAFSGPIGVRACYNRFAVQKMMLKYGN